MREYSFSPHFLSSRLNVVHLSLESHQMHVGLLFCFFNIKLCDRFYRLTNVIELAKMKAVLICKICFICPVFIVIRYMT